MSLFAKFRSGGDSMVSSSEQQTPNEILQQIPIELEEQCEGENINLSENYLSERAKGLLLAYLSQEPFICFGDFRYESAVYFLLISFAREMDQRELVNDPVMLLILEKILEEIVKPSTKSGYWVHQQIKAKTDFFISLYLIYRELLEGVEVTPLEKQQCLIAIFEKSWVDMSRICRADGKKPIEKIQLIAKEWLVSYFLSITEQQIKKIVSSHNIDEINAELFKQANLLFMEIRENNRNNPQNMNTVVAGINAIECINEVLIDPGTVYYYEGNLALLMTENSRSQQSVFERKAIGSGCFSGVYSLSTAWQALFASRPKVHPQQGVQAFIDAARELRVEKTCHSTVLLSASRE